MLSLSDQNPNRAAWISEISFLFNKCKGFYKRENNKEIEVSLKSLYEGAIDLYLRDLPYDDVKLIYKLIFSDSYKFIDEIRWLPDADIIVYDFSPKIGFTCILFRMKLTNSIIFAFGASMEENKQLGKNLKINGFVNNFILKESSNSIIKESINYELISYIKNNELNEVLFAENNRHLIRFLINIDGNIKSSIIAINIVQALIIFHSYQNWESLINYAKLIVIDAQGMLSESHTNLLVSEVYEMATLYCCRGKIVVIGA